jgi:signal transduction histidine kinase
VVATVKGRRRAPRPRARSAPLDGVPNRRRSSAERVLQRRRAGPLFTGIRRPLQQALRELGPTPPGDGRARRLLRKLGPARAEFECLIALTLEAHQRHLKGADYEGFVEAWRREGRGLAARGVPEEHGVAALAFRLEECLGRLRGEAADPRALALVRLTGAVQQFLLSGYTRDRAGWRRLDEQERLKLSRDLHDEIGADLVVLKLYLEMIALELERGNAVASQAKLHEALDLVTRSIESVRRLTLDLGPALLEQVGFLPAVRLYARQFAARTGIKVEVREADLPAHIPPGHETALYRVVQGALSNVAKHAQARRVRVSLGGLRDAVVVLIIEDDGVGFDQTRPSGRGFGLTAMRDRVQSLGGRLHVQSRSAPAAGGGTGTRIEIDLPVRGA